MVLGINNQDALSEDQENDSFINSAYQRFACQLYYSFGSFLASLSVGQITSRHYLSEKNTTGNKKLKNKFKYNKKEELKVQKSKSKQVEPKLTSSQYSMCYSVGLL